ncbi:MAG: 50S ribosomal protein L18 [bacterium]|nr:50S ribosomal protein L18 [bacterium]
MNKPKFGKERRQIKIRKRIRTVSERLRLTVFRSNKFIYAQIIDDKTGKTLISSGKGLESGNKKESKIEIAKEIGKLLAQEALKAKITKVVFDKGSYLYHGRVKALADGAREGGLEF